MKEYRCLLAMLIILLLSCASAAQEEGDIAITSANFAAPSPEKENLNEEWVEISNLGTEEVGLAGWTLEDQQNHSYRFPDITLGAGSAVRVHTGAGTDTEEDLYWNLGGSVWNNDGDVATLRDASGEVVSVYRA